MSEDTEFFTVPEVARLIRRSTARTYGLIDAGELPGVKIGRQVRIPRRAFEQWVDRLSERALAGVSGDHDVPPAAA